MAKYTREQLANMQEQIKLKKERELEAEREELKIKSAFFRGAIGKIFKVVCILSVVYSGVYIVDYFLSPVYKEHKIVSIEEDILDVATSDGWHIPLKYYWVYLNDENDFVIHMFHKEYEIAEPSGIVAFGSSPIFSIPMNFKVSNENETSIKNIERDIPNDLSMPITIFIVSLLWLLMKPEKSFQFIIYGYISLVVVPILLAISVNHTFGNMQDKGVFEMNLQEVELNKAN